MSTTNKYDYKLYLQIKVWLEQEIYWSHTKSEEMIRLMTDSDEDDVWANIFYDSTWDVQVCMYDDEELYEPSDWGWVCEMTDLYDFMEELDRICSQEKLDELDALIKQKAEFIYELCFTY